MVHSITSKEPVTLADAAQRYFPSRPHKNTVRRWAYKGYEGVKLQTFRCGRQICTTREFVDEFLLALNPGYQSTAQVADSSGHAAAEVKLAALGV